MWSYLLHPRDGGVTARPGLRRGAVVGHGGEGGEDLGQHPPPPCVRDGDGIRALRGVIPTLCRRGGEKMGYLLYKKIKYLTEATFGQTHLKTLHALSEENFDQSVGK